MHDNRLVAALRAQGRDAVLMPLYTPLRTDEPDVSTGRLHFGGLNVYLQHASGIFRRTPALLDRALDHPLVLRALSALAGRTQPAALGALTVAMLRGENGPLKKELGKLIVGLRALSPDLVHLPNLMFVGLARPLKAALGVPVLCGLAGEDLFLDTLPEPHQTTVCELLRESAADVDGFVALSRYYAAHAAKKYRLPADRVHVIPMGICTADFDPPAAPPDTPFTVGYLARLCPAKGLGELCRAFRLLHESGRACRLRIAGYLGAGDRNYWRLTEAELRRAGLLRTAAEYVGELSRTEKLDFLRSLHVLSVPAVYRESKGFYVLEALAAGVPVVQPAHGSFPELVQATGGGLLYPPGDSTALAAALARLADDAALRQRLATQGRAAVRAQFTAERMAVAAWDLYLQFAGRR